MSTKFFTNNERSLFDKFTGIIEHMKNLYAFHAVVGYFRSSGYFALQPYLKDIKEIHLDLGRVPSAGTDLGFAHSYPPAGPVKGGWLSAANPRRLQTEPQIQRKGGHIFGHPVCSRSSCPHTFLHPSR